MNTFVILFRRPAPALSDGERHRLHLETGAWVKTIQREGHELDPRILSAERVVCGTDSAAVDADPQVMSAILFLRAGGLDAAVRVAEAHPGLRYGFNVEVRPWTTPAAAAAKLSVAAVPAH